MKLHKKIRFVLNKTDSIFILKIYLRGCKLKVTSELLLRKHQQRIP
jgi:hypothetical protein